MMTMKGVFEYDDNDNQYSNKKDNNLVAEVDRNELLFWETDDVSDWRLLVVLEVVEDLVVRLTFETSIIEILEDGEHEDLVVRLIFETNVIEQHERRGRFLKMVSMRVRVVKMWRKNKPERSSCDP